MLSITRARMTQPGKVINIPKCHTLYIFKPIDWWHLFFQLASKIEVNGFLRAHRGGVLFILPLFHCSSPTQAGFLCATYSANLHFILSNNIATIKPLLLKWWRMMDFWLLAVFRERGKRQILLYVKQTSSSSPSNHWHHAIFNLNNSFGIATWRVIKSPFKVIVLKTI